MFEKIIIALILVLAAVPVFSGCTTADRIEDAVESKAEEAERIALAHAGLEAGQVFIDRTERDYDNGVWHYEVEFHVGFTEYEYDIDAETGKILSFDQDR